MNNNNTTTHEQLPFSKQGKKRHYLSPTIKNIYIMTEENFASTSTPFMSETVQTPKVTDWVVRDDEKFWDF
jgi:hypothetical protein